MGKKILSVLFFIIAILTLVGFLANSALSGSQSSAAAIGSAVGNLIPAVLYIFTGIFLLRFDQPTKTNYVDGFKKRSKQSATILLLLVAYWVLFLITSMGVATRYTDNFLVSWVIAILPYFLPGMVFVMLYLLYAQPHNASKKYLVKTDAELNQYLAAPEKFQAYSDDNFVLASDEALYFPQLFCVVPFDQIASTKLTKELSLQYVYFNLINGKKFYITTKHHDRILEAINAHSQAR